MRLRERSVISYSWMFGAMLDGVERSLLSELLDITDGTARRISATCSLRFEDLRLHASPKAPFGAFVGLGPRTKRARSWLPHDQEVSFGTRSNHAGASRHRGGTFSFNDRPGPAHFETSRPELDVAGRAVGRLAETRWWMLASFPPKVGNSAETPSGCGRGQGRWLALRRDAHALLPAGR